MANWHKEESASRTVGWCGADSLSGPTGWAQRRLLAFYVVNVCTSVSWTVGLSSSGIQGLGLAPHRAVQERRSDSSWFSEGHRLFWDVDSHGRAGAHQQDGADHPGRLAFPLNNKVWVPSHSSFFTSGSSWDGIRHGVSSPRWKGHKEGKTVHPLRTGSSARRPERGRGQSLHCSKRGKMALDELMFLETRTVC